MQAVARLKSKKNILALIPTVENMPAGNAYKPGDVITTYSGKTVQLKRGRKLERISGDCLIMLSILNNLKQIVQI